MKATPERLEKLMAHIHELLANPANNGSCVVGWKYLDCCTELEQQGQIQMRPCKLTGGYGILVKLPTD